MEKITNEVEFSTKGTLTEFENNVITTTVETKNNVKVDKVDLNKMNKSINDFINSTMGRKIEMKTFIRVVDESTEGE